MNMHDLCFQQQIKLGEDYEKDAHPLRHDFGVYNRKLDQIINFNSSLTSRYIMASLVCNDIDSHTKKVDGFFDKLIRAIKLKSASQNLRSFNLDVKRRHAALKDKITRRATSYFTGLSIFYSRPHAFILEELLQRVEKARKNYDGPYARMKALLEKSNKESNKSASLTPNEIYTGDIVAQFSD